MNNPVRVPGVTSAYREQQKAKGDWDKLVAVLDAVEQAGSIGFAEQVFEQTLFEIYRLLADVVVVYPTPNRISLDRTHYLIVLLVEVKQRALTLVQLDAKLDHARAKRIAEILFIAKSGKHQDDVEEIDNRILSEFASGQNVYVTDFFDFALGILILLGEAGRVDFLDRVGRELDRVHSDIAHRKAWAELLKQA